MRNRATIIRTAAVALIALAMGTTALGADSLAPSGSDDVNAAGMSAAQHATAHADLPSIASSVIAALTGGSNPSTTMSQHGTNDHANANASEHATNGSANVTTSDEDTDTDTDTDKEDVSNGQEVGHTGTAGTKPGFGCGDTNHEHGGPPGRPGATQPPGCAKSHD